MADDLGGFFFNVQKWRGSNAVRRMSFSERGVYLEMMCEQWEKRNLPDNPHEVADQIATTASQVEEVLAAWQVVRAKFVTSRGTPERIYSAPLEEVRKKQRQNLLTKRAAGREGGKASAAKRWGAEDLSGKHSLTTVKQCSTTVKQPSTVVNRLEKRREDQSREEKREKEPAPLSPAAPADAFTNPELTERAGAFIRRYRLLYPEHRHGARYVGNEHRDYDAAVRLCETWDDARLEKLTICFLTTDHKFAAEGSRTIPQLKALASWLDGELSKWEAGRTA